jgi:hypothetical protein
MRNANKILVKETEEKMTLGKSRSIWDDNNIKMDLNEIRWESVDWIDL